MQVSPHSFYCMVLSTYLSMGFELPFEILEPVLR